MFYRSTSTAETLWSTTAAIQMPSSKIFKHEEASREMHAMLLSTQLKLKPLEKSNEISHAYHLYFNLTQLYHIKLTKVTEE